MARSRVRFILCAVVLAFPALATGADCPPEGHDAASLQALRAEGFAVEDATRWSRRRRLTSNRSKTTAGSMKPPAGATASPTAPTC